MESWVRIIEGILGPGLPIILTLRKLKQKNCKFKVSLSYIA